MLSLDLLWVEIVCLGHIDVGHDVLVAAGLKHGPVDQDVVIESLVFSLFEVIHDAKLGRVVLNHELDGDGWHQTSR